MVMPSSTLYWQTTDFVFHSQTIKMQLDNIHQARINMIEQQIRPWNVLETDILALLQQVKREDYVPAAYKAMAFADMEIPLSSAPGAIMLAPCVEARMLQDLHVQAHEQVLEVGTGSGYMAALLSGRAQQVLSLEIDPLLADQAHHNLRTAGIHHVEVQVADGAHLQMPADRRFDVIILSGSVAQIPNALLQRLSVGGRLAAIVGDEPVMHATFVVRNSVSDFSTTTPWDTSAPRLLHFPELSSFSF